MLHKKSIAAAALVLGAALVSAQAHDESVYPDLKGQWMNPAGLQGLRWDPTQPAGAGQKAPLTPEYQGVFQATLKDRGEGGQDPSTASCLPPGMPRSMIAYEPMEIIVMPDTTYIMLQYMSEFRRVFTDGRKFPDEIEPSYAGYSIGQWIDENKDGKFDTLLVETRGLKGPRTFDGSGIPLHKDNETVIKEKIYLDKANSSLLRDEITTIDHALTKPWTVTRTYSRDRKAAWVEYVCTEDNHQVMIGGQNYLVTDDGYLQPTRKDQPAPDLRYFQPQR
jgi:hypothetical protein